MFYDLNYEKKLYENIAERASIFQRAEKDALLRQCVIEECKRDVCYFFDYFLFTDKNDTFFSPDFPKTVPFVLFQFQKDVIRKLWDCIVNGKPIFIEKSRQMGLTWLIAGVFLYGFLFHRHKYLIISQKEEYVDKMGDMRTVFEKLRFFMKHLPQWLFPEGFVKSVNSPHNKFMAITSPDWQASITWESANPNAGTWGTYKAILLDEMSKMNHATQVNTSCAAASPCRIYNSTPLGEGNEYYRMRKLAFEGKIEGMTLHWTLHPFYTKKWYEWKTAGMTSEAIAQELEISYNASIEWAVYKRFHPIPSGDVEFGKFEYDYTLPLYVSIDNSHGGTDNHAAIVVQTTPEWKIRVIDSVQFPPSTTITEAASIFGKQPVAGYKMDDSVYKFYSRFQGYKSATFIWDPYDSHSTWNDTSISKEYAKFGIYLVTPKVVRNQGSPIEEQIRITQINLNRIQVNEECTDFISAIQNARYPEVKEGAVVTTARTKPIHDWTSHFRTALEYMMLFITEQDEKLTKQKIKRVHIINEFDKITGERITREVYI